MERPGESAKHGDQRTTLIARSADEKGMNVVEKYDVKRRNAETLRYVERKLEDKGVMRRDKHPVDGKGGVKKPPPKQGRGGKFTWEGRGDASDNEVMPGAIDENDPNYEDGEQEENEDGYATAKVAEGKGGFAGLHVDPRLKVD